MTVHYATDPRATTACGERRMPDTTLSTTNVLADVECRGCQQEIEAGIKTAVQRTCGVPRYKHFLFGMQKSPEGQYYHVVDVWSSLREAYEEGQKCPGMRWEYSKTLRRIT